MRTVWVLLLTLACFQSAPAQHFDIWNAVLHPREEMGTFPYTFTTRAQALNYVQARIPVVVREQVDDYFPMVAVKLALLNHYPSTNAPTQALLSRVVPSGETVIDEVRYLAAFKREVQLNYPALKAQASAIVDSRWQTESHLTFLNSQRYFSPEYAVSRWMSANYKRAVQVVATMSLLERETMADLAADVDFVRDSALVKLREQNGFLLTAGRTNLYLTTRQNATRVLFTPLRRLDMRSAYRIGTGTAGASTFNIVPRGAVLVTIGTGTPFALSGETLRRFTTAEVKKGVKIEPIDPPTVVTHVANQSVEATTTTTVDYTGTFGGERLTYAVTSSQESVATVRLSLDAGILDIVGVSAGNTTVTLTASNEAGNAVTTFIATVTPRTE